MKVNTQTPNIRTREFQPETAGGGTASSQSFAVQRDLVSEEATFEHSASPAPEDNFLNLGRIARTRVVSAESQTFAESVGLYNNEERFRAVDSDGNGRLSVNEAARLESSSIEVGTGQTDAALNFFSQVADQVTGTDREEGVFTLEDIRFVQEAFEGGQSVELVERALLRRLNGDGDNSGEGVTPPLPTAFDEEFYLAENPDVAAAVANGSVESGLAHYNQHGKGEGRDPNPAFDEVFYLDNNPDVAEAVESGLIESGFAHFQQHGAEEGRLPSGDHRRIEESITLDQYITNFVDTEINFGAGEIFSGRGEVLEAYREEYGLSADTVIAAGSLIDLGPLFDIGRIPPGATGL